MISKAARIGHSPVQIVSLTNKIVQYIVKDTLGMLVHSKETKGGFTGKVAILKPKTEAL